MPKLLTPAEIEAALDDKIEKTRADLRKPDSAATGDTSVLKGAPAVRRGENPLTSRPFYLSNLVGYLVGQLDDGHAKVELEQCRWFTKALQEFHGAGQYRYVNSFLVPLAWDALPSQVVDSSEGRVFKSLHAGGTRGADPDELRWALRILKADLSAYDNSLGGTFVPPPEFGEPIELLRNEEVFMKAGARRVPLPPQGSVQYPRMTTPTTAYPQAEATTVSYSDVGTGDVTLSAKAYTVFVRMSNQLIRFAPALTNGLINADMTKSLALKIDLDALEGVAGGQNNIKGLINYSGINTIAATTTGANGDTLKSQDVYRMMAKVYANNAQFNGWIMRYEMWLNTIMQFRADAVSAADSAGPYLFNITRGPGDSVQYNLLANKVNCSNQVSKTRVKGSGVNLSYILGGDFSDYLMGMHGALELATNDRGDTAWQKNQTELRAICYSDAAPRHEASFVLCDKLLTTY